MPSTISPYGAHRPKASTTYAQSDKRDPPATLAAQLVEHHASTQGLSHSTDSATFRQLLNEIRACPNAVESDSQTSYKLISIVAEAGLQVSSDRGPNLPNNESTSQVLACLDVIQIALARNPHVVFYAEPESNRLGAQLCFKLLPRLISLLGRTDHAVIQDQIQETLRCLGRTVCRHAEQWQNIPALVQILQACVEDILVAIRSFNKTTAVTEFDIAFPSTSTLEFQLEESERPIAMKGIHHARISGIVHSARTIDLVTDAISTLLGDARVHASWPSKIAVKAEVWSQSCLQQLWTMVLQQSKNRVIKRDDLLQSIVHCLHTLSSIVARVLTLHAPRGLCNRTALCNISFLSDILLMSWLGCSNVLDQQFARCAIQLARSCQRSSLVTQKTRKTLGPLILLILNDTTGKSEVAANSKVSLRLISGFADGDSPSWEKLTKSLEDLQNDVFSAEELEGFVRLHDFQAVTATSLEAERPCKRVKLNDELSSVPGESEQRQLMNRLCQLLGGWNPSELESLPDAAQGLFSDLDEREKIEVLEILTTIPCVGNSKIHSEVGPFDSPSSMSRDRRRSTWSDVHRRCFYDILVKLLEDTYIQTSKKLKVLATVAVEQFASHSSSSEQLDLNKSKIGKWCLQCLRSSAREVRIAAANALPAFLDASMDFDELLYRRNRVVALNLLRNLSTSSESRIQESSIIALRQIASVCGSEELNLVLLQLIDYLGHMNPLICGLAHLELRKLAQLSNFSVEELMRPYWRTIAVDVVKDLPSKPQKAQQLADLLGLTVNQFLALTRAETLPFLVMSRQADVIRRIASASGDKMDSWSLCNQPRTLPGILSYMLTQVTNDYEVAAAGCLSLLKPGFQPGDFIKLLKVNPISVATEILKRAADEEDPNSEKAVNGFREFAALIERKGHSTRASATQARTTSLFFENHALGMMTSFSDAIDNPLQNMIEKKRCLRGMKQMILIAKNDITIAVPQIHACLQSALQISELCDEAFSAWSCLLEALQGEDAEALIEQTLTIIAQKWSRFSCDSQQVAYNLIASIFKNHGSFIQDNASLVPSLAGVPMLSKFESQVSRLKRQIDPHQMFVAFSQRCQDENSLAVLQALHELLPYLELYQQWIHDSASSEQPLPSVAKLIRALLDASIRFSHGHLEALGLCGQCLGIIGCLDPNRVDIVKESHDMIMMSNFIQPGEAVDFVVFLLEHVLVKSFHAVSNPRAQGFLAFVMQELLRFCDFNKDTIHPYHHSDRGEDIYRRWMSMPELVRNTLAPFLSSHYVLTTHSSRPPAPKIYPVYTSRLSHGNWLRDFTFDLLQRPKGDNAKMIFTVLARIIRGYDTSIATILLPFAAANIIIGGTSREAQDVGTELLTVLQESTNGKPQTEAESLKLCSENVFQVLDYLSRWLQEKKKNLATARNIAAKTGRPMNELEEAADMGQIESVENVILSIPSDVIARRAVECGSYARALLHWEECIRQSKRSETRLDSDPGPAVIEDLYGRLQDVYTQIDDPDGIEGVSAHLQVLSPDQQVLEHRRAGRWAAAQDWYELQLKDDPLNLTLQADLMSCLCEGGQFSTVMRQAEHVKDRLFQSYQMTSSFARAAWCTEDWHALIAFPQVHGKDLRLSPFNAGVGVALINLQQQNLGQFNSTISDLRANIMRRFSTSTAASLQSCHGHLLSLHALYECEFIAGTREIVSPANKAAFHAMMTRRLDVMGSSLTDKQYLLGIRRALMRLSTASFDDTEIAGIWMNAAKLSRKNNNLAMAYDGVMHALKLGDESAKIEQARLFWIEGEHRKAIKSLEGIIAANSFDTPNRSFTSELATHSEATANATSTIAGESQPRQNVLLARAHLLLAKWLDRAGQTQSDVIMARYRQATAAFGRWEKGFYYLGRYYNKLLESEKALPPARQHYHYLNGEMAKLVVENYLRSTMFGCKYLFQTLPKLLTLWLDFGVEFQRAISKEVPDDMSNKVIAERPRIMEAMNKQIKKYTEKIMPYVFYTALAQMISRISHPNHKVCDLLGAIIVRVVGAHPQQALWSLLAVVKSSSRERVNRGLNLLGKLRERPKTIRNEGISFDLRSLAAAGQKLSDELLHVCEVSVEGRVSNISLTKDLAFKSRIAPCPLVVPVESTISANLPPNATNAQQMRMHKPFPISRDAITISSFEDSVLILSSLQRPRKLTVRGSNGQRYGLLCKPNDDLRKDQRLMEFNAMINRSLKRDAESSKRCLYIKTYAVTPLNEACGLIEWVEGLKPMRDILVSLYRNLGTRVDYSVLRELLKEACATLPDGARIFADNIQQMYPAVLHAWFTDLFPSPDAWLAARTRYSRSCAVASMVGHALGLGDRHGENVLLEERTGGVFHVDFNCLFDKGLTFEKPELVPFRMTHNMVDACGATGVEGAWRKAAELAMGVMRANEDALLTILETFLYDPTTDFVGPPRKRVVKGVPETPKEVLESVRNKVRGLMVGESLPLSVQGHVDALVRQATDPARLCQMYIGWCAFL